MRTNIEVDEEAILQIMKRGEARSRKMAIEVSLERFIRRLAQLELLQLRGKVRWEGDLDEMRTSRYL